MYTNVDVQQKCIRFQDDTGATCNVLREDDLPEEAQILAVLEEFSLCHSLQWNHSQTRSPNWNQDSKPGRLQKCKTVQKKTRELQVHLVKDARHLNLCTSKVFAVKLEHMYIKG